MNIAEKTLQLKEDFDEVYEAGKQKGEKALWDIITDNRSRINYAYAFARWGCDSVKPPYKIIPTGTVNHMFRGSEKLKKIEKNYFDLSNVPKHFDSNQTLSAFVNGCTNLEIIEDINFAGVADYYQSFSYCSKLHTIERLVVTEGIIYVDAFLRCSALTNITVDGVIGKSIDFKSSPLSVASLKSVITHLKDYTGTTNEYACTVTFKTSAFEVLEAEGTTAPNGNTWASYIDDIKWNLVKA